MASDLTVQTIRGPGSGDNANKVIVPSGQTLDLSSGVLNTNLNTAALSGALPHANLPSGSIVQVVTNTITPTAITQSVSSFAEVSTTFRTSITPRFSNSKLLLQFTCLFGGNNQSNIMTAKFFNITSNSDIHTGYSVGSSRPMGHGSIRQSDNDGNDRDNFTMVASIASGSTSTRTYSIYAFSESGTTKYWNTTSTDNSGCSFTVPLFTIMEIAA
jgi:hypothetical protein